MKVNKPSRSAGIIAAHRAIESLKPQDQRICYDPYAAMILPPGFTVVGEHDISPETALELFKGRVPGFHEHFLARTRYIDEYLQHFIKNNLEQLVILGAGYDSRPYRFPELNNTIPIFEVDYPATQEYKIEKLKEVLKTFPSNVNHVSIDFLEDNLPTVLIEKGYRKNLKTLFIWEGVTMYIDEKAVDKTLSFISSNEGEGSAVIFDFTYADVIEGKSEIFEAKEWFKIASESDEPLAFGIEKGKIEDFLRERGFHNIECITDEYFKSHYFTGCNEGMKSTPILSLVHAVVGE
ncbi:SAM-dependent methyltransferase [Desulfospira joergensenii]|uniref:SAM-dependent methyltransferase n=1 Tax=Desulfospira joergensenii TaxID=53329 RepID=UPI0003B2E78F|nr:class I SAM-dependent methyltransferase [Desulfospira joergensenii]